MQVPNISIINNIFLRFPLAFPLIHFRHALISSARFVFLRMILRFISDPIHFLMSIHT